MIEIKRLTFNPISVNTYIIWDSESKETILVDVGCCSEEEFGRLVMFIDRNELKPVRLINTHGHFDHIWGSKMACDKWGLGLEAHEAAEVMIGKASEHSVMFGFDEMNTTPIAKYIAEGDVISVGAISLEVFHVPGHSPGSLVYYSKMGGFVITGDVIFKGSVGRTDLKYGDSELLIKGIKSKVLPLPNETVVYAGHGTSSTIGLEKETNPFLQ